MATAQVPRGPAKYDAYLDARLDRARKRVRAADLAASAFGLVAITLGYGLFMLLIDRAVQLPAIARQLGLVAYVGLAGYFVWRRFLQPLSTTINPYYAARQVERTLPGSKNSLVSWLDL
ncbi:MAG: hypothetical protein K1X57_10100, partial [Gemmataceae bacterium]|nr:hypothetical protein [Gemmataceae bacterium]